MTLKQKRKIVRKFWAGQSVEAVAYSGGPQWPAQMPIELRCAEIEAVIRDYMNGKFRLEAKRR